MKRDGHNLSAKSRLETARIAFGLSPCAEVIKNAPRVVLTAFALVVVTPANAVSEDAVLRQLRKVYLAHLLATR
jgi:hypothetical protein